MSYESRLVTKAQWGAAPARSATLQPMAGCDLTVHWEGPFMGIAGKAHSSCYASVQSIQAYHLGPGGFSDIAYNWVVCQHGAIFVGRGDNVLTGANGYGDANWASKAVCYLGGEGDPFTDLAKAALVDLGVHVIQEGGTSERWCHRDWVATACPGASPICAWVKAPGSWQNVAPGPTPSPTTRRGDLVKLEPRTEGGARVKWAPGSFGIQWETWAYDMVAPKGARVVVHPARQSVTTFPCTILEPGKGNLGPKDVSWGSGRGEEVTADGLVTVIVPTNITPDMLYTNVG